MLNVLEEGWCEGGRMNCKTICVAVLLLVLDRGCVVGTSQESKEEKPLTVSLISVIANPEKFDGRRLRVIGVLDYGGGLDGSVCLYISEPDARNGVMPNCISLDQSVDRSDKRLGKYVILNATFHYIGRQGLEYLSFKQIAEMELWPSLQSK